jgi:hypothetical protein
MPAYPKQILLESIVNIAPRLGAAEGESDNPSEFIKNFLPIPDYRSILDPNIFVILGGRGVGKTELFRLLAIPEGRQSLVSNLNIKSLPDLNSTTWVAGFGRTRRQERKFPTPELIEKEMNGANNIQWRSFWIGLIIGVILQQENGELTDFLTEKIDSDLVNVMKADLSRISEWKPLVYDRLELLNRVLDELEDNLIDRDRWLFINYDELDRLVTTYNALADPIKELLALWLDRSRRWDRIRPKIFLRVDLFRDDFLSFPDASKLKSHQMTLEWKYSWLYQLLIKRLANASDEMKSYLQEIPDLINSSSDVLGFTPKLDEKLFEQTIEKFIGKYMGTTAKKGITYRWIPNHLQDAGGRIAPRSFLKLFSLAAQSRMENMAAIDRDDSVLLEPADLQGALMRASEDRITELQEEYLWLDSLKTSLAGQVAPIPRDAFLEAIASTTWTNNQQPPVKTPEAILTYLIQLDIVESRTDGRINMPEIYLYGFGVKRKGGVKRPK